MSEGFVQLQYLIRTAIAVELSIARALSIHGRIVKPFASYETFYEHYGGWNRYRTWTGVTLPLNKHVLLQPSYMWESSEGSRDVHYVLFGLIRQHEIGP